MNRHFAAAMSISVVEMRLGERSVGFSVAMTAKVSASMSPAIAMTARVAALTGFAVATTAGAATETGFLPR
jgi:hypothetical protein